MKTTILRVAAMAWAASCVLSPANLLGVQVEGESRSYLWVRESAAGSRFFTLYEYLDTSVAGSGAQPLSFHFGGWGRVDLEGERSGDSTATELQYGYLQYRGGKANSLFKVGRFHVSEGVASAEKLDGVYAGGDLKGGVSLALFAGVPTETDEGGRSEDLAYGLRLSQGLPGLYRLGFSYFREDDQGDEFREEGGVDFFLRPLRGVHLDGRSRYSLIESDWMDHEYSLYLGPYRKMSLTAEAWWIRNVGALFSPRDSFLSSPSIGGDGELLVLGGEAAFDLPAGLVLALHYRSYQPEDDADGDAYGGSLRWRGDRSGAGLTLRLVDGGTSALRYTEYRGYFSHRFQSLTISFDALDVIYDEPVNDTDSAYALVAAAAYDVTAALRVAGDVEYGSNPYFEEEVKAFVKLLFRFSADMFHQEEGP